MKRLLLLLAVTAVALAAVTARAADKYPSRPIRMMVPFGAGSATDITIRIVGEQFRQITGQGFVVENKPGAFGILAIEEMVKAPPDGYTLEVGNAGTNVLSPIIYKSKFKFDYDSDVTIVTRLGEVPLILAATTKDFEPKTYAEFIAYAKAHPGAVRYASVGVGSNNHYDTESCVDGAHGSRGSFGFLLAVGCKSCVRPVCAALIAAGPDVIRRSSPYHSLALKSA